MKLPASWMKYVTDVATAINELEPPGGPGIYVSRVDFGFSGYEFEVGLENGEDDLLEVTIASEGV